MAADVDLSDRQKLNQINALERNNSRDLHYHYINVCSSYIIAFVAVMMFVVLAIHYILPHRLRFLSDEEMSQLQTFALSGLVGGIVTKNVGRLTGTSNLNAANTPPTSG